MSIARYLYWLLVLGTVTLSASFCFAAQGSPAPKKVGPPVLSGKSQAGGSGNGVSSVNGKTIGPAGSSAGTAAISGKR